MYPGTQLAAPHPSHGSLLPALKGTQARCISGRQATAAPEGCVRGVQLLWVIMAAVIFLRFHAGP